MRAGIGTVRLEAAALGLLAALPVVPYLVFILRTGVPRFELFGDFALLEQAVRHVWSGDTLLGPYSRFRWSHPGPLFFYFAAPFQAAFGSSSTGLYVATCAVNAAASATIVSSARLFAQRSHAVAALAVVLAWFVAFGNVTANPWNPLVVVLPLTAFLLTAAIFACGRSKSVYPAVVFGALVAQHHIAAVSTVLVSGLVALIGFLIARHRAGLLCRARSRLVIALAALVVLFAPPLIEELTSPIGNLTKLWSFFSHRAAPLQPVGAAIRYWATAMSWMPERVAHLTLLDEGYIPLPMRWDPMPDDLTTGSVILAVLHVASITGCVVIAGRRRDMVSLSLLCFGAMADVVAVAALRAIVGESFHYLLFWTTAGSTVAWFGMLSTLLAAVGSLGRSVRTSRRFLAPGLAVLAISGAGAATAVQQRWLSAHPVAPASRPLESDDLRAVHGALRERLAHEGSTPVVHPEGAWDIAHAMVLELEKDQVDVRVPERHRWNYVGVRSADGLHAPLHVYFSTTPLPLPLAECLELITKSGDISMFGSPRDVSTCGDRSARR